MAYGFSAFEGHENCCHDLWVGKMCLAEAKPGGDLCYLKHILVPPPTTAHRDAHMHSLEPEDFQGHFDTNEFDL